MGHDKLRKFAENETFPCLLQPSADELLRDGYFALRDLFQLYRLTIDGYRQSCKHYQLSAVAVAQGYGVCGIAGL